MRTTIDDLLAEGSDFRLCDEVFLRLDAAAEALGVEPTGTEERTILLTWHASGVVGNGGFEYLFEGGIDARDPGYAHTLAGFEAVNATESAAALREALGWFPGSIPPENLEERLAAYRAVSQDERQRSNERFWRGQAEFEAKLAAYIRRSQAVVEETLRRYEVRMPPGLDPDTTRVVRCGVLRLCGPPPDDAGTPSARGSRLETLVGDEVVRTFDLTEWTPELDSRLVWWPSAFALLAALAFPYVRAYLGLPRWVALAVGLVLAVVAVGRLERRLSLVLHRGAARVEVHTWSRGELDGRTMSFLAAVFSAAGVVFDDDP